MAKQSGLGDNYYIQGYDLSDNVSALSRIGGGPTLWDVTTLKYSAFERIGVTRDGAMEFQTFFDDDTAKEHVALKDLPYTDVQAMYCRGTALGSPAASLVAKQLNYDWTRGNEGSLAGAVSLQANGYGLEWGRLLTAGIRTDTTATSPATGIDTAASLSFGGQAYLQVFAFTGTSFTVTIQDSADNSNFTTVTSFAFAAANSRSTQRIAIGNTATIRRYIRAITTGTFTNAQFAVNVVKNEQAGVTF